MDGFEKEIFNLKLMLGDTRAQNGVMPVVSVWHRRFAQAVLLAERIYNEARGYGTEQAVAWRCRDLNGDGWIVFATREKAESWLKNNASIRSYNSIQPLYAGII